MFARVKTTKDYEYLQIIETYRDEGRVRQRMVLYVGHYPSIDDALWSMKRELTQARRKATQAENRVEYLETEVNPVDLPESKADAQKLRDAVTQIEERLHKLERFLEEHPDVLDKDRARVERDQERSAEGVRLVTTQRRARTSENGVILRS